MELELEASPDAIAKITAFKPLMAVREGRARTQAIKIVWHDSPDHALQARGLSLAESRGAWRLERLTPGAGTWLPAQPAPLLEEAETRDGLTTDLPSPLAPVAAFEGRRTVSIHKLGGCTVTLSVDRGILRSVTAEQPAARLLLSGEDQAVRTAATLIGGSFTVRVPVASLAAQGIALATGNVPAARHHGAPALPDADMSVVDALTHILGHLTDVILYLAPIPAAPELKDTPDTHRVEAVHQMRVAVRRALSALSIFREALPDGTLDPVRDGLKTLGATLGHTRDWDVFVAETAPMVTEALPADEKLERLIAAAVRQRRDYRKALAAYLNSPVFRLLGIELAWFAAARGWYTPVEPPAAEEPGAAAEPATPITVRGFAPMVVRHRWKKLLAAGKRIEDLDVPALHGVRLRAKRARYAAEMFSATDHSKAAQRAIRRLAGLQQSLGVLNDGAVAAHLLDEIGGPFGRHAYAVGLVIGFTASRAASMRPQIIEAFEKVRRHSG